jgi:RND family efflux transporter MFP subunit
MSKHLLWPVLAILLAACDHPPAPAAPPRPALVMTVGTAAGQMPTVLVGEVRSRYESSQGFRVPGKIVERKVEMGSQVKKGQVLARLDASDAGLSVLAARAEVSAAETDHALAKAELERQRQLYQRKFISAAALDSYEARFKSSAALVEQANAKAAVTGNQSGYTALTADRDGVITEIHAEPGQVVAAGEPVARIAVPGEMEVQVAVPESRMQGVVVGTPAEVRLWASQDKGYQGKVREIAPAADSATRTFQVRVAIPQADGAVRLGMTAGIQFLHGQAGGLLVPGAAVTQRDGKTVVWVVDGKTHKANPRPVQVGEFREDGAVILSGLQGGEQVVVAGAHTLVPGLEVRLLAAENNH